MTSVLYFFMFWTFLPKLWSQNLAALVQWTVMLPENFHAFFAYIKHIHFTHIFAFYKFEDKNISFLMYWLLLPSI